MTRSHAMAAGLAVLCATALAGCGPAPVRCLSYGIVQPHALTVTITGLANSSQEVTVQGCIAGRCEQASAHSRGGSVEVVMHHDGVVSSVPVTVVLSATRAGRTVLATTSRTVTPVHRMPPDGLACHPETWGVVLSVPASTR